jgi:predicted transcriptional regulator YdeE
MQVNFYRWKLDQSKPLVTLQVAFEYLFFSHYGKMEEIHEFSKIYWNNLFSTSNRFHVLGDKPGRGD